MFNNRKYFFLIVLDGHEVIDLSDEDSEICFQICEILCFIVKNHSFRSKYFILGSKVTENVCLLLKCKKSYIKLGIKMCLILAAIRFFRKCIGMKDEFYNRHLIVKHVFTALLDVFKKEKNKQNLIHSACLDTFEFIRNENIKTLINHVIENHRQVLEDFNNVAFKEFIFRFDDDNKGIKQLSPMHMY